MFVVLRQIYVDFTYILKCKKLWCVKILLKDIFLENIFFLLRDMKYYSGALPIKKKRNL